MSALCEKRLAFLDLRESVADVRLACTDRFHFAALQLDARFVALKNVKIAERLPVQDGFRRHVMGEAASFSTLAGRILLRRDEGLAVSPESLVKLADYDPSSGFASGVSS